MKRQSGKSIRVKLIISFLLLTLILTILVSLFSYVISFQLVRKRISDSFSLTLDYISADMAFKLDNMYSLSDFIFINQPIKDAIACGTEKTLEANNKTLAASRALTNYVIPQFYENVNRITIIGFNGFRMQNVNNYSDFMDDGLSQYYEAWKNIALDANGKCVWSGLITRKLNPYQKDSVSIQEAILYRTIKNTKFTEPIGVAYISINTRLFLNQIQGYHANYPDYDSCSLFILDDSNNIINAEDCLFSPDELQEILQSPSAATSSGFLSNDRQCVVFTKKISDGWRLVGTIPTSLFLSGNEYLFWMSLLIFPLCIVVCGLIWLYISTGIFRPIHHISTMMQRIAAGESALRIKNQAPDEIGRLAGNLNNMLDNLDSLNRANTEKELQLLDATYQAKQTQINPHFIYNTLNSIRWMAVMINAENIRQAIDAFGLIVKYNMNRENKYYSTVAEEIKIVQQYVYLQKLSYPGKFDVRWDVSDEALDCRCIKFFLQPIVENSILHGAFAKSGECMISISAYTELDQLVFNIYDDGTGIDEATLTRLRKAAIEKTDSSHVGLSNIFERLRHVYGGLCTIDIASEAGVYTNIMIKTPLEHTAEPEPPGAGDRGAPC